MSADLTAPHDVSDEKWKQPASVGATRPRRNRSLTIALLALIVGVLGVVLYKGLTNALVYFYTVQQALADRSTLGSTTFRMEGVVVKGSIDQTKFGVDFDIRFSRSVARVIETGAPPQLFQPNVPVVVVGYFSGPRFISDQIMIKHSANYVAAHPGRIKNAAGNG